MYTNLKQQGINTFEYTATLNGKEKTVKMPTEDILDMYPGLRETITKTDFPPTTPKVSAPSWKLPPDIGGKTGRPHTICNMPNTP